MPDLSEVNTIISASTSVFYDYDYVDYESILQTKTFFDLNIRSKHAPASIFDDFGNIKDRSSSFPANQFLRQFSASEKSSNSTLDENVENWLESLRIVNGDNVERGAIPWQIGLRLRRSGGPSDSSICGGSIIRKVFINFNF